MKFLKSADESGFLAEKADKEQRLYFIPAFTGLGAPYWKPNARGAIFGLNRNTSQNEIIKAALESIAYQTLDLINAMYLDLNLSKENLILRVDGGMSASDWTMQNLSNILQAPVDRPVFLETTALGAAWLAGLKAGLYPNIENFSKEWNRDKRFNPKISKSSSENLYRGWQNLLQKFY